MFNPNVEYVCSNFKNDKQHSHYITVKCKHCGNLRTAYCSNIVKYQNCKTCGWRAGGKKLRLTQTDFITKAKSIFGNRYDYSKVKYTGNKNKVCIICPEHGEFWITPAKHLYRAQGCPICTGSNMEKITNQLLLDKQISFEKEKLIKYKNQKMFVDFVVYVKQQPYFIELNGIQHYTSISYFGGIKQFIKQQKRDLLLQEYCTKNKILLFWVKYDDFSSEKILEFLNIIGAAQVNCEKSTKIGEDWEC